MHPSFYFLNQVGLSKIPPEAEQPDLRLDNALTNGITN